MSKVFLSLGTNLGDRMKFLNQAIRLINKRIGLLENISSVYQTEPWGFISDKFFLNQVIIIQTVKSPDEVLNEIKIIEDELGRTRTIGIYAPRKIDIDILFYDDLIINENNLQVPHPHLHKRKFTLIPLIEIAPAEFTHPVLKEKLMNLLNNCIDNSHVELFKDKIDPKFTLIHEV